MVTNSSEPSATPPNGKRLQEALRQARDELEHRVEARTADLVAANQELQEETAQRLQSMVEQERLLAEVQNYSEELRITNEDLKIHAEELRAQNETLNAQAMEVGRPDRGTARRAESLAGRAGADARRGDHCGAVRAHHPD